MPNIKLQSSDGEIFETDIEVAKTCGTIKTMLEDLGMESMEDDGDQIIPLANVKSDILRKVLQWATYHKDDAPPAKDDAPPAEDAKRTDEISAWDAEFMKVDKDILFDLILAGNYLDIKGLMHVSCTTVANMIKGKNAEEIRQTFGIKNDFTTAEEEQIRKENEYCEEK